MRKAILFSVFALLMVGALGCSDQADTISFEELLDGKVDNGSEVNVIGKAAYFKEINKGDLELDGVTEFDIDGPTQVIALVNENSKTFYVYNELDVTGKEVAKDEEVIVEGKFYNKGEDEISVIQAIGVNEK